MAAFIAKFVGKKIMAESLENKFGQEDPYFETIPATRLDGKARKGKAKKRRKALPPGLPEHDARILTKVKRRAYRLDMCLFSFMGVPFGWGSVIGLVPGIGDVIDALLALMVMKTCLTVDGGLPSVLKTKMVFNIFFDFILGLVPFLGDIVDAVFRANTRNVILLEEHLRQQGKAYLRQSGQPLPATDPSDPKEFDRMENSGDSDIGSRSNPRQAAPQPNRQTASQPLPTRPEAAGARGSSRWFSRQQARSHDVETGRVGNT